MAAAVAILAIAVAGWLNVVPFQLPFGLLVLVVAGLRVHAVVAARRLPTPD